MNRVPRLERPAVSAPDFTPETVNLNSWGVRYVACAANLEVRTVEALNEVAWRDRISRAVLIEEILVAYLRDCFPDRTIPTREEARFDSEAGEDLPEGPRHYEHDELHWRSTGHRGRNPRERAGLAHRSLGRARVGASK